jgi:(1->4)-alpha-D-glucan 1-alpha-D-glucosylmutase
MSLILDIVPNHMGAAQNNPWWMDLLENGTSSLYADYFDIDWHPLTEDLKHKILLPILGDAYGQVLKNGEIQLRFDRATARFWLDYYEHTIPVNPVSYPFILGQRLEVLEARLGQSNPAFLEYQSIMTALEHLPVETEGCWEKKEERTREKNISLGRLLALGSNTPEIFNFIQETLQDFQTRLPDITNQNRLHRLLEMQVYRLSNWRVASDEINYRRFFDINDLVALRVEDPRVFAETHAFILRLIEEGWISGLRIDHPDGLYDPAAYFKQLQMEAAKRLAKPLNVELEADLQLSDPRLPLYVVIEKILAPYERLPQNWLVQGTTGYEFANTVNGLFVQQEHEKEMTRIYEKTLGQPIDFEALVHECKKLIMRTTLNSELGVLTQQLYRLCKQNWSSRDFTLHNLRSALMEVVACFPVYRTYVTPENISKKDGEYIDWAINLAKRHSTAIDSSIYDFLRSVLLLEAQLEHFTDTQPTGAGGAHKTLPTTIEVNEALQFRAAVCHFAMKFQQYSGPVMAKGLEDTSFYQYNRLVSLNEVGGEPKVFGISAATFHYRNQQRLQRTPHTLLCTTTHDTKRSEDVRARISVLSELPEEWHKHLTSWRRIHRHLLQTLGDDIVTPCPNDEYLFYQTLLGIWPFENPKEEERVKLADRLEQYMLKAAREAKRHTSWINPNLAYEAGLQAFIRGVVLKPSPLFTRSFLPFQRQIARLGQFNALAQTLLKLTCPGVPDLYQGCELWDLSLVDPDNRRPVDYALRQTQLEQLQPLLEAPDAQTLQKPLDEIVREMNDGRIKQYLIAKVLGYRKAHPELFQQGLYLPLEISGIYSDHVVAFVRWLEQEAVIVAVPRLNTWLGLRRSGQPCGKRVWKNTQILLPDFLQNRPITNLLTLEALAPVDDNTQSALNVSEVFKDVPVGFLRLG